MLFPPDAPDLLRFIPLSARTILHAGCGSGRLAAALRGLNPKATQLGIDIDPAATTLAAAHIDQVVTADLEAGPLPFELPDSIDCIVYNEVLEHLRDPVALLQRHAACLSPDGIVLICSANTHYWRHAERMLRGTTDDTGGPPPRHLFSLDTVRDKLSRAGLTLCDSTNREPDAEAAARFAASLALGLEALGIEPREYASRATPSHTIWRARRHARKRMMLSSTALAPVGGVTHVRVLFPIEAVATDPLVIASVTDRVDVAPADPGVPHIFILHRPALVGDYGHALLRQLTTAGCLVITEFDDLPDDRFEMMRAGGALTFYGAHAIQTSTTALAASLRKYNPEIAVFPNAVGILPEVRNFTDLSTITIFFGALNREQDWRPFMPAINDVIALAGERLRFQVIHDMGFFQALRTPHKTFTPICDYDTYMRILGQSEISFMPLADTPFNRAKSDLKYIEAASCRVTALASTVVYANTIDHGRTGLLFRDPVEFHDRLLHVLALPEHAQDIADAARQYVADHRMLAYQVAPRIAWYRSLWMRRDMLQAARLERMQQNRVAA